MLSGESLAIAEEVRLAMIRRHGADQEGDRVRTFDTICSATQERQDAVEQLLRESPPDLMFVVGGYNSSNTCHLAALSQKLGIRTFHLEDAACVDLTTGALRHQPVGATTEEVTADWLGEARVLGITAGASTPNNKVGETVTRIAAVAGLDLDSLISLGEG